jgi:hypothetical protein
MVPSIRWTLTSVALAGVALIALGLLLLVT